MEKIKISISEFRIFPLKDISSLKYKMLYCCPSLVKWSATGIYEIILGSKNDGDDTINKTI